MFVDRAKIYIKAGDGGNGAVSFRREKFVPRGGPDGGDGGRGGDVILEVREGMHTLMDFRYKQHYKADRGEHGSGSNKRGKDAADTLVFVPPGTLIRNAETGQRLGDLLHHGQRIAVAKGGRGGRGNARFATSVQQAPRFSEKGEPGEELWIELELKVLADVGLVGYPNAGKSTLISAVSKAKPKVAPYPFTTLTPNLGVVRIEESKDFVIADIPGLIEGAHKGVGLGHDFLRHIERTRVLLYVIDLAAIDGRDPIGDVEVLRNELGLYNPELLQRPALIVANKMDIPAAQERAREFVVAMEEQGFEVHLISAVTGQGIRPLLYRTWELLEKAPKAVFQAEEEEVVEPLDPSAFSIRVEDRVYIIEGKALERRLAMTDINNEAALLYFHKYLERTGILEELREAGVSQGDTVRIADTEFEYSDEWI